MWKLTEFIWTSPETSAASLKGHNMLLLQVTDSLACHQTTTWCSTRYLHILCPHNAHILRKRWITYIERKIYIYVQMHYTQLWFLEWSRHISLIHLLLNIKYNNNNNNNTNMMSGTMLLYRADKLCSLNVNQLWQTPPTQAAYLGNVLAGWDVPGSKALYEYLYMLMNSPAVTEC